MNNKLALLWVHDNQGIEEFARSLIGLGYSILSCGGTFNHLIEHRIVASNIEAFAMQKPVFDQDALTLVPQVHAILRTTTGRQAKPADKFGRPKINLLYVTFNPLEDALDQASAEANFSECIEATDIDRPPLVMSACKGGDVIILTSRDQEGPVLNWMKEGGRNRGAVLFALRGRAAQTVAKYLELSASVYPMFGLLNVPELVPRDDEDPSVI